MGFAGPIREAAIKDRPGSPEGTHRTSELAREIRRSDHCRSIRRRPKMSVPNSPAYRSGSLWSLYRWFYDKIYSHLYDLAIAWVFLPFGGEKNFRNKLLEPLSFSGDEEILELCCGTGGCTMAIREKSGPGTKILGCDLSYGQIRAAKRKNGFRNVDFFVADARRTGLPSGKFDMVLVTHALHEMPRGDRLSVLAEAKRLTRQDGTVVVLELARPSNGAVRFVQGFWLGYWIPWPINFENRTRRDMLKWGLANEVSEAGFTDVKTTLKFSGSTQVVTGRHREPMGGDEIA